MALDRLLADEEGLGELFIRTAFGEETKDLLFSRSKTLLCLPGPVFPFRIGDGLSLKESGHKLPLNP